MAAILIGVGLFSTMEVDELVSGLSGIGLPHSFAFVVGYAFVLIYLSLSDLAHVIDSMRLKGVELSPRNPLQFLRNVPKLIIPAMLTVMRRGGAMTAALETRGFSNKPHASVESARLAPWDNLIIMLIVVSNLAALKMRLYGA